VLKPPFKGRFGRSWLLPLPPWRRFFGQLPYFGLSALPSGDGTDVGNFLRTQLADLTSNVLD